MSKFLVLTYIIGNIIELNPIPIKRNNIENPYDGMWRNENIICDIIIAAIIAAFLPIDLYKYAVIIINGINLISSSPNNCIIKRMAIERGEPFIALSVSAGNPNTEIIIPVINSSIIISIKPIIITKISLSLGFLMIFAILSLNTYNITTNGAKVTINDLSHVLPVGGIINGVIAAIKNPINKITTFFVVNLESPLRNGKSYSLSSNLKNHLSFFKLLISY